MGKNTKLAGSSAEKGVINAPWEKTFDKILTPFEEFVHRQTTSGLLLMATAILALVLANSGLASVYQHLVHTPISINIGGWALEKTLHHWVNDGLMALFFFVVGLELKREILVGELAVPRQAALPIIAAIGGMLYPRWCILPLTRMVKPPVAGGSPWLPISPLPSVPWCCSPTGYPRP